MHPARNVGGRGNPASPCRRGVWTRPALLHRLLMLPVMALAASGPAGAPELGVAHAASVWYVAPGGATSLPCGGSQASPCATLTMAIGEAGSGDTINIDAGTYTAQSTADLVVVNKDLTLQGTGQGRTILDGNRLGSVVTVLPRITAAISGVTVQHGSGTSLTHDNAPAIAGGGILNQGTLTLSDSSVSALALTLTVDDGNIAEAVGGGIYNADGGSLTVLDSTISNNAISADENGWGFVLAVGGGLTAFATAQPGACSSTAAPP